MALPRTDIPFPRDRWVRITTWLDLDPDGGAAAVWQNGVLVSAARVNGGDGSLDQMHFGLYAALAHERQRDQRRHLSLPGDSSLQVTPMVAF